MTTTFTAFSGILVVAFMGIFFAYSPEVYVSGFVQLFRKERRPRLLAVFRETAYILQRWLIGKVASMIVIGVLVWIGLGFIGVKPVLALATLAALLTFIPYLGPFLSAIPGIILGLAQEPILGLYATLVYIGVQFIEGNFITPIIERKSVWLPPALTIFSQMVFTLSFGFLGILLASPITAVAVIFVRRLYIEDLLEAEPATALAATAEPAAAGARERLVS